MAQISILNLSFSYEGSSEEIFKNVTFQIDSNWKLGLIGRNGRGKTTLLKLLQDKYEYRGEIIAPVIFEYFPYEVKNDDRLTSDILEEIDPSYELWKVSRELNLLDVEVEVLDRSFKTLSNGEQTKVMLAVLFAKESAFLLIDEPTNHLDMAGRESVMAYLNKKKGFILVSHDRHFMDGSVDHILAINPNNIEVMRGNFSTWWEQKKLKDTQEYARNEQLKKDVQRLAKNAREVGSWSDQVEKSKRGAADKGYVGHKSAKMMKRAKVSQRRANEALEEKKQLLKNIETTEELKLFPLRHHKDILVVASNLSVKYTDQFIFKNLNFQVKQGESIALVGKNGSGKSSILKLILGEDIAYEGELSVAPGLKISYVSQQIKNLSGTFDGWIDKKGLDGQLLRTLLRKLDFKREHFERRLEDYSDGQRKKLLLAASLSTKAQLYIWDEPLNYIDVFSRIQLEELIHQFKPTLLLVEHDKMFLESIQAKQVYL